MSAPAAASLLNALPQVLLCVDAEDRLCFANTALEEQFQVPEALLRAKGLAAVLPADSGLLALVGQARAHRASFVEYDVEIGLLNGVRLVADIWARPLADRPELVLIGVQSRTVERMIERQQSHKGGARAVVGAAAMLAHEIKNPLSGIRGAAQLLEEGVGPTERELTQLICAEVDRIRALVDRMEIFTDARPLARQPENIHAILGHVRQLGEVGFARGLTIREHYDPSLPDVLCSREQLVQVFLNLLKNAAEAVEKPGGEIVLTTAYRHGMKVAVKGSHRRIAVPLEVCVSDSGPGAPDDLVDHLFEPFVSGKPNGTGLGLALVAKVIGDHGGVVEYHRTQDPSHTTFRVLLPIYQRGKA